jgi:hypothetical protein
MCVLSLGAVVVYAVVDWAAKRDTSQSPHRARRSTVVPSSPSSSSLSSSATPPPLPPAALNSDLASVEPPALARAKPHNLQSTLLDILHSIVALPAIYWCVSLALIVCVHACVHACV